MTRRAAYREALRELADWEPFLLANSGLPGPRGNLELAQAVADEGHEDQFRRWRAREAVAMALQRWGDEDLELLLHAMVEWSHGSPWKQRTAAAALCEPRLLTNPHHAASVLRILDDITTSLERNEDHKCEAFRVLRQGLGYCWSVAVCACPEAGKPLMEHWFTNPDADIRWIMRENLRKNRLARLDPQWTANWLARLV
jgi:hypothetical protein